MTVKGTITKCVAGVYEIFSENGEYLNCYARGKFRNKKVSPMVGDKVVVEKSERLEDNTIIGIDERKNQLLRPPVANVDTLVITLAVEKPEPDLKLVDYLVCYCRMLDIEPIICINKNDYGPEKAAEIANQYRLSNIRVFITSAVSNDGISELKDGIKSGITCFCGQSAVGKSSMMNLLCGEKHFETGELSRKTDRGKNTTRHIELVKIENDKWIADTPGFSLLDLPDISPDDFKALYYEFDEFSEQCRFNGCNHVNEPDCAVKQAVLEGKISKERHERYKLLFEEVNEKWRRRYD